MAATAAIAHQAASQGRTHGMGISRAAYGRPPAPRVVPCADVEGTHPHEYCTNAPLRKGCEGDFEIAIGSGIHNNELPAQPARRRLQVCWGPALPLRSAGAF